MFRSFLKMGEGKGADLWRPAPDNRESGGGFVLLLGLDVEAPWILPQAHHGRLTLEVRTSDLLPINEERDAEGALGNGDLAFDLPWLQKVLAFQGGSRAEDAVTGILARRIGNIHSHLSFGVTPGKDLLSQGDSAGESISSLPKQSDMANS
jgi:hypothetical protein